MSTNTGIPRGPLTHARELSLADVEPAVRKAYLAWEHQARLRAIGEAAQRIVRARALRAAERRGEGRG